MFKIIFLLASLIAAETIYDFTITDINGKEIQLSDFRGKKILLVNTASDSKYAGQYESLERLYQLYKDSLVIIAFPSNSFGKETADNATIKQRHKISFILAEKTQVTRNGQDPLYSWLTQSAKNGVLSNEVKNDFYKFLIDQSGKLVGVFAGSVDPMSEELLSAVRNNKTKHSNQTYADSFVAFCICPVYFFIGYRTDQYTYCCNGAGQRHAKTVACLLP